MKSRFATLALVLCACRDEGSDADTLAPDTIGIVEIADAAPEIGDADAEIEEAAAETEDTIRDLAPLVETVAPTALPVPTAVNLPPISGFSVNARIHPRGLPATWRVEYGPTADYGDATDERALPGKLDAHFTEDWAAGTNGWLAGFSGVQLVRHDEGGPDGGPFVRYTDEQGEGDDVNHFDGIGIVHLGPYLYAGNYYWAEVPPLYLGGGFPDLRGARLSLSLRGVGWDARGTDIATWIQGYRDPTVVEVVPEDSRYPNYANTGNHLGAHLASGAWERASWTLTNSTHAWTFAGAYGGRLLYDYGELDTILRGVNVDIFVFQILYVDLNDEPSGSIDAADLDITYRQRSLTAGSNGGALVAAPADGSDASSLTDGWRFGPAREWLSAPSPATPQVFEYSFASPVMVTSVNVVNAPEHPSKEIEIALSDDGGQSWTTVATATLPEVGALGPNYAFYHVDAWVLVDGVAVWAALHPSPVDRLRVTVLSGYGDSWGLGEIEAFGSGAFEATDDDWYDVTRDILVAPGAWHFRVVATTAEGAITGPDQRVVVPPIER